MKLLTAAVDLSSSLAAYLITVLNGQFWSTLIGVVVGGVITFMMQIRNEKRGQRQEAAIGRTRDLAISISLLMKAVKMFSNISHVRTELENTAKIHNIKGDPHWEIVKPFVGRISDIEFSDAERIFVVKELRGDFLSILEMTDIHNNFTDIVRRYSELRLELATLVSADHPNEGSMTTSYLTAEQIKRLTPRFLNLKSLVDALNSRSKEDRDQALRVFNHINGLCAKKFGQDIPKLSLGPEFETAGGLGRAKARGQNGPAP